jgi:formamidase
VAQPPNKQGALLGRLSASENKAKWEQVASEGARTIPPREHGGNCDIKNISRGSRVYFPVYVDGAKLSLGDIHFSQGDGEISFCGAIEMV